MDFSKIIDTIGTPSYVFCSDIFIDRAKRIKKAFGPEINICYSMKANPFLLKELSDDFSNIEVCSPGELKICEKLGVSPEKIIFSGVNKTYEDVLEAMNYNVGIFTAESIKHMELIDACAKAQSKIVPVLLRIANKSQFGIDKNVVTDIIRNRNNYGNLRIAGIHFFTGTQKKNSGVIIKELNFLAEYITEIKAKCDFTIERIEYGTGLFVDYFSGNGESAEFACLEEIVPILQSIAKQVRLTVEMGRFFAASCGFYLTKIVDIKNNDGTNYAICDGGMNHIKYDGQIQGMKIPSFSHFSNGEKIMCRTAEQSWTICGSLCTTADVIMKNVPFSSLKIDDILVLKNVGAYSVTEGTALFLSRELPSVYIASDKNGIKKVRQKIDVDYLNTPDV